jgi:hypothetical protein
MDDNDEPRDLPHLQVVANIARANPQDLASRADSFRYELRRRLHLRGWTTRRGLRLEPGSLGPDSFRCGSLDTLCYPKPRPNLDYEEPAEYPPIQDPPVLLQIERNQISYRTRAKLQSWGKRPTSGKLVVQLFASEPDPIPEADLVLALGHARRRVPQTMITDTAMLKRFSHAIGVHQARNQIRTDAQRQRNRDRGGRAGMRARKAEALTK